MRIPRENEGEEVQTKEGRRGTIEPSDQIRGMHNNNDRIG
jgi:hypothetical protein